MQLSSARRGRTPGGAKLGEQFSTAYKTASRLPSTGCCVVVLLMVVWLTDFHFSHLEGFPGSMNKSSRRSKCMGRTIPMEATVYFFISDLMSAVHSLD
jgi:hypothetical protein